MPKVDSNYAESVASDVEKSTPPLGFKVIIREFKKDKVALTALIILILIALFVVAWTIRLDVPEVMRVDVFNRFHPPVEFEWSNFIDAWNGERTYLLGADESGIDVFHQLIVGTGNSVIIGFLVTTIMAVIGIGLGVISGYYGGAVDNAIMRFTDFIMILPTTMIVIVFIVIIPEVTIASFVFIMSIFAWTGFCRTIRSRALSEGELDYISASKTMGTPTWKIILSEMLPNLASLIMIQLILSYAANIGLETGLTFLGFGLPPEIPTLGTLVSAATSPENLELRPWVWLPASLTILTLMLCINYVGQALKRSTDAKQRLG
ncbi:Inner membrane ABC transporter permease protein yejE [Alloiococcus otitis]|uniref:ABC transmembrane type-1 domain-containing protein n=1 Tax=Alloiococcus otitis ATCC 51267 TaxID=883081 RepID=K9EEB2_9LACT|nr:ABC transporter permease [Alloiococcus otitis]EKU94221.1 hypothetical protein HMPREF9698_00253 [Alloiococcus otitis ATCC 51267]SUU81145.1 Inner membrane ABC transporter permease protein yejE [Alloiococcus otitis]